MTPLAQMAPKTQAEQLGDILAPQKLAAGTILAHTATSAAMVPRELIIARGIIPEGSELDGSNTEAFVVMDEGELSHPELAKPIMTIAIQPDRNGGRIAVAHVAKPIWAGKTVSKVEQALSSAIEGQAFRLTAIIGQPEQKLL